MQDIRPEEIYIKKWDMPGYLHLVPAIGKFRITKAVAVQILCSRPVSEGCWVLCPGVEGEEGQC